MIHHYGHFMPTMLLLYFSCLYAHLGRGVYYAKPSIVASWILISGILTLFLCLSLAVCGYILPWGTMSYWAMVVIINVFSVLPLLWDDICDYILGGFYVQNRALCRLTQLHFFLPILAVAWGGQHILQIHRFGSAGPSGVLSNPCDRDLFIPYYFKDVFLYWFLSVWMIFTLLCVGVWSDSAIEAD